MDIINKGKNMSNMAYFFCDVDDFEQLKNKTLNAQQMKYKRQKYKILDTAILSDKQFKEFKKNIRKPMDFLKNITSELCFSDQCEYICLAVTNKHSDAIILVCSFQYSYPKFVAVVRRNDCGKEIY